MSLLSKLFPSKGDDPGAPQETTVVNAMPEPEREAPATTSVGRVSAPVDEPPKPRDETVPFETSRLSTPGLPPVTVGQLPPPLPRARTSTPMSPAGPPPLKPAHGGGAIATGRTTPTSPQAAASPAKVTTPRATTPGAATPGAATPGAATPGAATPGAKGPDAPSQSAPIATGSPIPQPAQAVAPPAATGGAPIASGAPVSGALTASGAASPARSAPTSSFRSAPTTPGVSPPSGTKPAIARPPSGALGKPLDRPRSSPPPDAAARPLGVELPPDDDLDAALDAALTPSASGSVLATAETDARDLETARETFRSLGVTHLRPVLDAMVQLRVGVPPVSWLEACVAPMQQLKRMAIEVELEPLGRDIDVFLDSLEPVRAALPRVDEAARSSLLEAFRVVTRSFPGTPEPSAEWDRREPLIVRALLLQVPGVRSVAMGKLFAAGLNRLDALTVARADEIAATTGIDRNVAVQISDSFRSYRDAYPANVSGMARSAEIASLRALLKQLRTHNEAYAAARAGWSHAHLAERKATRSARAATLLHIHVLLARLGELDRIDALEPMPFEGKIAELERFLSAAL